MTIIHVMRQIKGFSQGLNIHVYGLSKNNQIKAQGFNILLESLLLVKLNKQINKQLLRLYQNPERALIKIRCPSICFLFFPLSLPPRWSVSRLCSWHCPSSGPLHSSCNYYNWSVTSHAWLQLLLYSTSRRSFLSY